MKPICYAYPMLDFTDDSGMGEMMAAMLAWMAEQERKMIVRRVKAGLAARKAKGLRLGRVPLPMKTVNHARRLRETGLSCAEIGKALKISKGGTRKGDQSPYKRCLRAQNRLSPFGRGYDRSKGSKAFFELFEVTCPHICIHIQS